MNILFRCDAGSIRGSGHLVRCLTLADALAKQGCAISFLCRQDAGEFLDHFKVRDFTLYTLPAPAAAIQKTEEIWDESVQRDDFEDCRKALDDKPFDWVIVDHYGLSAPWEILARNIAKKILVIDDLANRPHDCDVLLDQNEYADKNGRYSGLVPAACHLMPGGKYVLLRDEFPVAGQSPPSSRSGVERILVLMGGSDYHGLSLRLIEAIEPVVSAAGIGVDIILGQQNRQRAQIETIAAVQPLFRIYSNHPHVSSLMLEADIAFGAGGTATWEFACLGVPLLMITFADNQIKMAQDAEIAGFARYIGHFDEISDADIAEALTALIQDHAARIAMSAAGRSIVDGNGANRVADFLTGKIHIFTFRRAGEDDCRDLFEWRNDALTREMSLESDPVPFATHQVWFEKSLAQASRILAIAEKEGQKIGMVRFDLTTPDTATISINLNPAWRGRGYGKMLLQQSEQMLPDSIRQIRADIKTVNHPSIRAFEEAGYRFQSKQNGLNFYIKYLHNHK